ncbi:MAG: thioredoxin family protein [Saprospiraceae bacterium]|nr:thioredoxin family protein [Saprospiraceae bacterium]
MRTYSFIFVLFFLFLVSGCKNSGTPTFKEGELTWLTIAQLENMKDELGNKKVLIDVYTEWCGWCKVMDKKTFTDPGLIKYLNENFYVVKFDAEQKEPVTFKGTEYQWQAMGRNGINNLGLELLQGNMGYPSLVYMDSKLNSIRVSPGYKTPEQLMEELQSL